MTPLHKSAAFIQGVRQELLANGFSEADALVLSKRASYERSARRHPDDFYNGYFSRMQIEQAGKRRRKRVLTIADVVDALPYIAGMGSLYALFGTRWGDRRIDELRHLVEDVKERNELLRPVPVVFPETPEPEVKETSATEGKKQNNETGR